MVIKVYINDFTCFILRSIESSLSSFHIIILNNWRVYHTWIFLCCKLLLVNVFLLNTTVSGLIAFISTFIFYLWKLLWFLHFLLTLKISICLNFLFHFIVPWLIKWIFLFHFNIRNFMCFLLWVFKVTLMKLLSMMKE